MGRGLLAALCLLLGGAASAHAASPVLDCRDRMSGATVTHADGTRAPYRFVVRSADLNLGPISFSGLKALGTDAGWRAALARNDWIKSVAMLRPGARVTLTVPPEQRGWMTLEYGHQGSLAEITLSGCRRVSGARAVRRECGRGSTTTCTRDRTPFGGGFRVDFATAPAQGRCAELLVAERGKAPRRVRLFAGATTCPTLLMPGPAGASP